MPCYHPLIAWQTEDGSIVFAERGSIRRELTLPCGQCIGCRLERSRQWAIRCLHESQLYLSNSFITLTYNEESLPPYSSLNYPDFQNFMKRLRNVIPPKVRFFMCGEYGDQFDRPHYHACLFNCHFADREFWRQLPSGANIYRSKTLESLWPNGYSSIGDVTFESAAYVARYCVKKITGPAADAHYSRLDPLTGEIYKLVPEFTHMSLKPGIGAPWFAKFRSDVYSTEHAGINLRGLSMKPPRYYDNLNKSAEDFLSDYTELLRFEKALKHGNADSTSRRLRDREAVAKARLSFKKRTLL